MISVCAPYGFAQSDQGAVAGVIRDETGAVLPGATITVRNLETEISNSAVSDMQGRFEFLLLPAGDYELQASCQVLVVGHDQSRLRRRLRRH